MHPYDPLPPLHPSTPIPNGYVRDDLRASLRLIFSPRDADAFVAGRDERMSDDEVARVIEQAKSRIAILRVTRHLTRWFSSVDHHRVATDGYPSRAALVLVLHLGLAIDGERLADLTNESPERIGHLLYLARQALAPQAISACGVYASRLARYRDDALPAGDRIAVSRHAQECTSCQSALAEMQELDSHLLAACASKREVLDRLPPPTKWRTVGGAANLVVTLAVAGLLTVLASVAVAALTTGDHVPIPLVPPVTRDDHDVATGWLLVSRADGSLEARHVDSGHRHTVPTGEERQLGERIVSPDGTMVSNWYWPTIPGEPNLVTIATVDGQEISRVEWTDPGSRRSPIGWFSNSELLVIDHPERQRGETETQYRARADREARLYALDIASGAEREIVTGYVVTASVSPQGTRMLTMPMPPDGASGMTLDLWSIDDAGMPRDKVTILESTFSADAGLAWSADGRTIIAARKTAGRVWSPPGDRPGPWESDTVPRDILAIDETSAARVVARVPQGTALTILGTTPDGAEVIYVVGSWSMDTIHYTVWSARVDGQAAPRPVATLPGQPEIRGVGALRSPDGLHLLIPTVQPLYLRHDPTERGLGDVMTTALLRWDAQSGLTLVSHSLTRDDIVIGWLPESSFAYDPADASASVVDDITLEPASRVRIWHALGAESSVSADGRFVLLTDTEAQVPTIWDYQRLVGRRVLEGAFDLSWVDPEHVVIGVASRASVERGASRTRIALYDTRQFSPERAVNYRHFDPAAISERTDKFYARPLVSPDGAAVAFHVVDRLSHTIEMSVARLGGDTVLVARWSIPRDHIVDPPLTTFWLDNQTLIYSMPDVWEGGLPTQAVMMRVRLLPGDSMQQDELQRFFGHGADRGVHVAALALSSDHSTLALRMRHWRSRTSDGMFDTIHLMPTSDISHEIEIDRGRPGSRLMWSSDRNWLVFDVSGRVVIASADARHIVDVATGVPTTAFPIWVSDTEVWFMDGDGPNSRIMRAQIHWQQTEAE